MISALGFTASWIVFNIILSMFINTARAKNGVNLNDAITAFLGGFTWGPIGIISGLDPNEQKTGRGFPKIIGGIAGTVVGYSVYQVIF